jgi:hypothetical protein
MMIQISIDTTEPLAGKAVCEHGGAISFTGWFELLRAISALVDPTTIPGDTGQPTPPEPLARPGQECDRS